MARSSAYHGHLGLGIGRRLGGDALQPQTGRRQDGKQTAGMPGRVADHLVAHADHQGHQRDAHGQPGQERGERNERIEDHADEHEQHQEAGAAAGMIRCKFLRGLDRNRLAGLEIEDHFVLGAVVLENPLDILEPRDGEHEREEDGDADGAIGEVERQPLRQRRVGFPQPRRQVQRQELVEEQERPHHHDQVGCEHPLGKFPGRLPGRIFAALRLDLVFHKDVGGELQRLDAQLHGLVEGAHAAEYGQLEDGVLFGNPRQVLLFGDDFAALPAHRHAVAVRGAHHHAFHHRLAADEGFLAAFQNRQDEAVGETTKVGTQGHGTSHRQLLLYARLGGAPADVRREVEVDSLGLRGAGWHPAADC